MYQEVCFNRGTETGGERINVGFSLSPPSHFLLATGLLSGFLEFSQKEKGDADDIMTLQQHEKNYKNL